MQIMQHLANCCNASLYCQPLNLPVAALPSVQTLYESAVAFGMRKALQTEQGKNEMEGRIGTLEGDVKDLERQVGSGGMQQWQRRRFAGKLNNEPRSGWTCVL